MKLSSILLVAFLSGVACSRRTTSGGGGPLPPECGTDAPCRPAVMSIGTNLNQNIYWSSEWVFADAYRRAYRPVCVILSGPGAGNPDPSCTIEFDAEGWPISSPPPERGYRTVLFASPIGFTPPPGVPASIVPGGRFHILYEGDGALEYSLGTIDPLASSPGHDVLDVVASNDAFAVTIIRSNVTRPVRNIRVIMPGGRCGSEKIFASDESECARIDPGATFVPLVSLYDTPEKVILHPLFHARAAKYSTIRPMWLMLPVPQTIADRTDPRIRDPLEWSERPKLTDAYWADGLGQRVARGVPVEALVEIANRLQTDLWVSIHHLATEEYVRNFAIYVRDHLAPGKKVYVEWSNEIWNDRFYESGRYARERGLELGLSTDPYEAMLRYYAQASVERFRIWHTVYGEGGRPASEIVRVVGLQAVSNAGNLGAPWPAHRVTTWNDAYKEMDAIAIAPYLNPRPDEQPAVATQNLDQFFEFLNSTVLPRALEAIRDNGAYAKRLGLQLVAYEGGQHLVELIPTTDPNYPALSALFDAANRDPRMGDIYRTMLTAWKDSGGSVFSHFINVGASSSGGAGRFGALESMLQERSPKYDALMSFIDGLEE